MKSTLLFISTAFIVGCNVVYKIDIKKDGSAHIEQQHVMLYESDILALDSSLTVEAGTIGGPPEGHSVTSEESVQPYIKSSVISNFVWTTSREAFFTSSYDISNVDSLGNYIDVIHDFVHPTFKLKPNQFEISCPPGYPEVFPDTLMAAAMFVEINFKLPFKITSISSNNSKFECTFSGKHAKLKFRMKSLFYHELCTTILIKG